ncbi:MAG: hypothetical protein DMG59_28865 [Acidobacteria bacterium]|nr:MAG: hypothetical protein DMG59_28865 [Acidobacteriota bacterium]
MSVIAVAVVVVPCMLDETWRNQLISMLPPQVRAYLEQHAGKPHVGDVRPADALRDLGPGFVRAEVVLLAMGLFASIVVWKFTQLFYRKRVEALSRQVAALKDQLPPEPVEKSRPAQRADLRPEEIVKEILDSCSGDIRKFLEWMLENRREVSQIAIDGMRNQCGLSEDAFARACSLGMISKRTEKNPYGWGAKTGTVHFYSVDPQFQAAIVCVLSATSVAGGDFNGDSVPHSNGVHHPVSTEQSSHKAAGA